MNRSILYTPKESPPVGEEVVLYILKDKVKPNREMMIAEEYKIFNAKVERDKDEKLFLSPIWLSETYELTDVNYWSFTDRISAYKGFVLKNTVAHRMSLKTQNKWKIPESKNNRNRLYIKIYPDATFGLVAIDLLQSFPYGMELLEHVKREVFY